MRFSEVYEGWDDGRVTRGKAASSLEVCERTFRRYLMRYQAEVLEGLVDRRLEQVSEHVKAKVNVAPVHRGCQIFCV